MNRPPSKSKNVSDLRLGDLILKTLKQHPDDLDLYQAIRAAMDRLKTLTDEPRINLMLEIKETLSSGENMVAKLKRIGQVS